MILKAAYVKERIVITKGVEVSLLFDFLNVKIRLIFFCCTTITKFHLNVHVKV